MIQMPNIFRARRLSLALLLPALLFVAGVTLLSASSAEEARTIPAPAVGPPSTASSEVAVLAGGCFWGVQGVFQHVEGVRNAVSGYAGGGKETAEYERVSSGTTGHAESVQVTFDPGKISYGRILQIYFSVAHDPTELNYRMNLTNDLFGFQLGGGLSYCVTDRLTAYSLAKFGVFDNHVTQTQQVSGTGGNATINNGPFAGQEFNVHSSDNVLACAGQLDVGGRYAINSNWSFNFGYRVVGLAGVAISEVNAIHNQFQNVAGIASQQTTGSFILHGGFLGATYCW